MPVLKKPLSMILLSLLTACAPAMNAPPETVALPKPSPVSRTYSPRTLTDAGLGVRTALDLSKGGNFEAVLIVCQQVAEL